MLTHRWIDDLGAEGVVIAPHRLIDPLRAALLEAFRSAALTGSIDGLDIDRSLIRSVLDENETEEVLRWIGRKLMRHDPG